jgi:membrane protease YdiL (CAAX protease family)
MARIAFLLMVAEFGIFLALLFNRTKGHLVSTILAHFSLNMSLAVGGAILGSVFICVSIRGNRPTNTCGPA